MTTTYEDAPHHVLGAQWRYTPGAILPHSPTALPKEYTGTDLYVSRLGQVETWVNIDAPGCIGSLRIQHEGSATVQEAHRRTLAIAAVPMLLRAAREVNTHLCRVDDLTEPAAMALKMLRDAYAAAQPDE